MFLSLRNLPYIYFLRFLVENYSEAKDNDGDGLINEDEKEARIS